MARSTGGIMQHTTADGATLYYQIDGPSDAPTLLFVHSIGTTLHLWDAQAAAFSADYRVVRYDARGHGQSSVTPQPGSIAQFAADVVSLLDALGVERAHICGLSLGGLTAQWTAIHHPERVARLVLANTAARIGSVEGWNARIAAVRAGGMAAIRELALVRFFSAEFRARRPEVVAAYGAMLTAMHSDGYVAACAALRDADLHSRVGTINAPTLIVAGGRDEATTPAEAEALHAAITTSALVVLPEAGHLSNVEQPDAFNEQLLRFLSA
jgi:3-oxoadipate enol-lactonase